MDAKEPSRTSMMAAFGRAMHRQWHGLAPAEMEALVRDCGHTVDENVEPADLEARYFADRNDGLRP